MTYDSLEPQALEALPAPATTNPDDDLALGDTDTAAPVLSDVEGPVLSSVEGRRNGWTGFARRLFLEVLSETGRVSLACEYCRLTRQSAYALRNRDPVFAASWDAACELARAPLADALYERALEGATETLTRNGEVIAERHRHDSRLSIAVLHRLDKRCDRAAEHGAHHLTLAANWDAWLKLVASGEDVAARALLESAAHGQFGQLLLGENPTADDAGEIEEDERVLDLSDRFWRDGIADMWMTDFPPPEGFDGYQSGDWGEDDYERACTAEEAAILDAYEAAGRDEARMEEEELCEAWLEMLNERSQG